MRISLVEEKFVQITYAMCGSVTKKCRFQPLPKHVYDESFSKKCGFRCLRGTMEIFFLLFILIQLFVNYSGFLIDRVITHDDVSSNVKLEGMKVRNSREKREA